MKTRYLILSVHLTYSMTRLKPIDIVNGYIKRNDTFDTLISRVLFKDYISQHKYRSHILYEKISKWFIQNNEEVIEKWNEPPDKSEILQHDANIYIKKSFPETVQQFLWVTI